LGFLLQPRPEFHFPCAKEGVDGRALPLFRLPRSDGLFQFLPCFQRFSECKRDPFPVHHYPIESYHLFIGLLLYTDVFSRVFNSSDTPSPRLVTLSCCSVAATGFVSFYFFFQLPCRCYVLEFCLCRLFESVRMSVSERYSCYIFFFFLYC